MRTPVMVVWLAVQISFTLQVATVHADEECFAGYRDITPEERGAMTAVLESALRSLAPPPDGWVLVGEDDLYLDPRVCRDDETRPWTYELSRSYERVDDRAQRENDLHVAGTEYQTAMKAKQPRMDAIMARIQELSVAAVAAAEKGDFARVEAINVEIEQASAEYERVMAEGGTLDKMDAANEEAARDRSIRITVTVNAGSESVGYRANTVAAPAGAQHAFRWSDTRYGKSDETELVLFGPWRANGDRFEQVLRANARPTGAQAISVHVTADASRIDSVLASIDSRSLASLPSH